MALPRAGQISSSLGSSRGVEGYTESAASGILAGVNMVRILDGLEPVVPPPTTMLGGLYRYLRDAVPGRFQPMNSNWGLVDPLPKRVKDKKQKRVMLAERAQADFLQWMTQCDVEQTAGLESIAAMG